MAKSDYICKICKQVKDSGFLGTNSKYQCPTHKSICKDHVTGFLTGKVTEHLIPYLPQFTFNPKDVRFVGSPIDLIVFDGMCDDHLQDIVFVEVKTGPSARLTPREKQIKDAVEGRRVRWVELRIDRATLDPAAHTESLQP